MRIAVLVVAITTACKGKASAPDAAPIPLDSSSPFVLTHPIPSTPSLPVPADWPAGVPIFAGAHISKTGYHTAARDGGLVHELEFQTTESLEHVIDFYKSTFSSAKKIAEMNLAMTYVLQIVTNDKAVDIAIVSTMGATQVSLTVTPN